MVSRRSPTDLIGMVCIKKLKYYRRVLRRLISSEKLGYNVLTERCKINAYIKNKNKTKKKKSKQNTPGYLNYHTMDNHAI